MLKKDKEIVKKYLGSSLFELISPKKDRRWYSNTLIQGCVNFIVILTKQAKEEGNYINEILSLQKSEGFEMKAIEHRHGDSYVYTFELVNKQNN